MSKIVWLASYPKSGNTWLRVFLTNYARNSSEPADIDHLDDGEVASSWSLFERVHGPRPAATSAAELDARRRDVYRALAREASEPLAMKVHDAYTRLPDGQPLLPPEATRAAVYVVRNPLDVAAAGAPFIARDRDVVVAILADDGFTLCPLEPGAESRQPQLPQRLSSWSRHVQSWADCADFPVHVVRYEDMSREPEAAFGRIVRFLGLPLESARLCRAIAHSRFDVLRAQEARHGFHEKPAEMQGFFFRKGRVGAWREELGAAQVARLVGDHRETMRRFGYLDARDEPV